MANLMIKISGEITIQGVDPLLRQLPFGLTVELTTTQSSSSPGGWIGSSPINNSNFTFEVFTAYAIAQSETVNYAIYKDSQVIQQGQTLVTANNTSIELTADNYADLFIPTDQNCVVISGNVSLGELNINAVPVDEVQTKVYLYKSKFRTEELIATSAINTIGDYRIQVPGEKLYIIPTAGNFDKSITTLADLFLVVKNGQTELLRTPFYNIAESTEINLHIELSVQFSLFKYEFEHLKSAAMSATSLQESQLHTISIDGDHPELDVIVSLTGLDAGYLTYLIKAFKINGEKGINAGDIYALYRVYGANMDAWVNLTLAEIIEVISNAATYHIVTSNTASATAAAIAQVGAKQAELPETEDNNSVNVLLNSILASQQDVDTFVRLSIDNNEDKTPEEFWDIVTTQMGAAKSQKLQKGMQLLGLTGMQPEITTHVVNAIGAQAVRTFALKTQAEWNTIVNTVCSQSNKLCVPFSIRGNSTDPNNQQAKNEYAKRLYDLFTDTFATFVMGNKISSGQVSPSVLSNPQQSASFITNNPDYDLRNNNIWDFDFQQSGYPTAVRDDLMKVQNILRITNGKPDTVTQLLNGGIKSSSDIVLMGKDGFLASYGTLLGGVTTATAVFQKASQIGMLTSNFKATLQPNSLFIDALPKIPWPFWWEQPAPAKAPTLEALFGSMDLCSCSECMSMYSPAAYYTDILNYIYSSIKQEGINKAFTELIRRRPDLQYIDLTCKNSNTAIPYVDLVNELLECLILKSTGATVPDSLQTTGTSKDLDAYPEHTVRNTLTGEYSTYEGYKVVYDDILSKAIYPSNLPFSLPLAETRTYFNHLGYSRYNLLQKYKPKNYTTGAATLDTVTEYTAIAELLSLSKTEANIITKTTVPGVPTDSYRFYGFTSAGTWYDLLCKGDDEQYKGLNLLLHRATISYKELLQLLNCEFLNKKISPSGSLSFEIVAKTGKPPSTCVLDELEIKCNVTPDPAAAKSALFDKLHRFVRLAKACKWSFYQLDMVLSAFSITDIDVPALKHVGQVHLLANSWRSQPESIAAFWGGINTRKYINYDSDSQDNLPSLYERLFQNKSLINPPPVAFSNPAAIVGSYTALAGSIVAAINVKEEELTQLLQFLGVATTATVTLNVLSRLYALAIMIRGNGLSVADFIRICALYQINGTTLVSGTVSALYNSLQQINGFTGLLNGFIFTLDETEYLLANLDPSGSYIPVDSTIQLFYETLRTELKKQAGEVVALDTDTTKILQNIVLRAFSNNFNLEGDTTLYLLRDMIKVDPGAQPLLDALVTLSFINATSPIIPGATFDEIYNAYRRIQKISMVTNRYKLSNDELQTLIDKSANLDVFNISSLPVTTGVPTAAPLQAFVRLNDWIKLRGVLNLLPAEFISLMRLSIGVGADGTGTATKAIWKSFVSELTGWTSDDLNILLGDTAIGGLSNILGMTFSTTVASNDYKNAALLLQMNGLMYANDRMGLKISPAYEALTANVSMAKSWNIRTAAKAKHTEEEWLRIAKPLQDTLREQQRKSLVAYIIARPTLIPAPNMMKWKNENELYAYLMIDVEMQPCMKTSRIKQAISTVQQFMDRLILNLEYTNGNPISQIRIEPDQVKQWKSWRKWYRIWEANRKIFLYPENWIEPELRDNKTPIFKELETQLLQDEVTEDKVEDAYMAYLESLEEVARLEPVGSYHQVERETVGTQSVVVKDCIHVFGRTSSLPHRYYYRRLEQNEWSPWEKINADIKSDHITPVIWNGKLYLFWLTFQKKKPSDDDIAISKSNASLTIEQEWNITIMDKAIKPSISDAAGSAASRFYDDASRYNVWEVTLNWSQYKDSKWLANELSKDVMMLDIAKAAFGSSGTVASSYSDINKAKDAVGWLTNRYEIRVDDLFKNRLYLYAPFDDNNEKQGVNFSIMFVPGLDETATGIHTFFWREDNSQDPFVNRTNELGYQILAPQGTRFNKMKFIKDPNQNGKLVLDNTNYGSPAVPNTYYSYSVGYAVTNTGIIRSSTSDILNQTPFGTYKLTARGNTNDNSHYHFQNPLKSMFLYEDEKNTYFVRWEPRFTLSLATESISSGLVVQKAVSFTKAIGFSAAAYPVVTPATIGVAAAPTLIGGTPISAGTFSFYGYRFHTFYHAQIKQFIKQLNQKGIPGLLRIENQKDIDTMAFATNYLPTSMVINKHPRNNVQFEFTEAYSIYNWELFFHAPMLIAQQLSNNQQFEAAQKWYHYIFNPTSNRDINNVYSPEVKRFWKFYPFYKEASMPVDSFYDFLESLDDPADPVQDQIEKWEKNPFNPHIIARMRTMAYMKNVVMKYLDNLIAWGDQLFRRDTIESINEATQLYVLASNLLGQRPQEIPARTKAAVMNFDELNEEGLDSLSNALVNIESFYAPSAGEPVATAEDGSDIYGQMFYFCLPKNEKLLAYWETIADRLFKIRNCMNIDGAVRQLPLFEPPIDPALLVRAAAMGVDINSILDTVSGSNRPHYRFSYMLQKANEFCNDVRGLGGSLLAALEKKDGEDLALLRSSQELNMLEKIRFIREQQVAEATENLESIRLTKENAQIRYRYYSTRPFMNSGEQKSFQSVQQGMVIQAIQAAMQSSASALSIIPQFHIQAIASGTTFGGQQLSAATNALSQNIGISAIINNAKGSMAATLAGYERRRDDWNFQAETAQNDIEQIDKQILAAEIRLDIAQRELANHELQMENTQATDAFMRNKFTNKELYSWMSTQVAATYFQSYQLAYDIAKQTEACYSYELPVAKTPVGGFIKFGYWDSLRKGLLSGDKLQFDLRKMEATYMAENEREFELTKSISLALINPAALIQLIESGSCDFTLDKVWYDLDFPAHYMRKIKSVSISIPCVAGPYTTVGATLKLNGSDIELVKGNDLQPVTQPVSTTMATSSAQNDSGVFELNFRDERYIPFENAGAVSSWTLSMMSEKSMRQFNYSTISDVIIHIKYTARAGTPEEAKDTLQEIWSEIQSGAAMETSLPRFFSLRHEFSQQWFKGFSELVNVPEVGNYGRAMTLSLRRDMFPNYAEGAAINIASTDFTMFLNQGAEAGTDYMLKFGTGAAIALNTDGTPKNVITAVSFAEEEEQKDFNFIIYKMVGSTPIAIDVEEIHELLFVANYKLDGPPPPVS